MQDDSVYHQRRSHPERDNVRNGIELSSKRAFISTQPGDAPVERIEDARHENTADSEAETIVSTDGIGRLQEGSFQDLQGREKPAAEISRRH